MDFSSVCRVGYINRRALFARMESADDGVELFYYHSRVNFHLWRRGGAWVARYIAADPLAQNFISARRSCLRGHMGALASAPVVYRRTPQSVDAVLGTGFVGNISLFLAGHNIRAVSKHSLMHVFSRFCQCFAVVVRAQI